MNLIRRICKRRLSDVTHSHDNYFNLLRFFAAISIIYIHSYSILGVALPRFYFDRHVDIFFVISGFLVTKSLLQHNLYFFIRSRILRIIPALFFVLLLTAFVLGPIVSTNSLFEYLTNVDTYTYVITNTLLIAPLQQGLPGVFGNNPVYGINGSLWTLPYEIQLYAALAIFAAVSYKGKEVIHTTRLFQLVCVAYCATFAYFLFDMLYAQQSIYASNRLPFLFFSGSVLWLLQSKVILSKYIVLLCAIILYITSFQPVLLSICINILLPYFVLYIAYLPSSIAKKWNVFGNYSYGIYIYAWPIQQTLVLYMPHIGVFVHCIIAIVLSTICGYFSWNYIEKPALNLR